MTHHVVFSVAPSARRPLLHALRDELRAMHDIALTAPDEAIDAARPLLPPGLSYILEAHLSEWGPSGTDVLDLRVLVAVAAAMESPHIPLPVTREALVLGLGALVEELRTVPDRATLTPAVCAEVLEHLLVRATSLVHAEPVPWLAAHDVARLSVGGARIVAALVAAALDHAAEGIIREEEPW